MQDVFKHSVGDAHDAAGYCSDYTSKTQPSSEGIFGLLHREIARLQEDPELEGKSELYRACRMLIRMQVTANRRTHRTMPEMVYFLMNHDEGQCTHPFTSLFLPNILHFADQGLQRRQSKKTPSTVVPPDGPVLDPEFDVYVMKMNQMVRKVQS